MDKIKQEVIDLTESIDTIIDHLDVLSSDRLAALMDRIGFELMDRDSENVFKLEQAENEYLNSDLILQNGELSA